MLTTMIKQKKKYISKKAFNKKKMNSFFVRKYQLKIVYVLK